MVHDHAHDPTVRGNPQHLHDHAPGQPHPAQVAAWSILRMPITARLGIAAALSAALWIIVLIAMR